MGYRLDLGGDGLDVALARALLRVAKAELEHDPSAAHAHLLEADGLWRGPALADFADLAPFAAAAAEAEQLHREVTDTLIAAAVAAGQAESVLALAAAAVGEDPLRERAVLLQMKALAATGEARAALQVARDYRRRLVEETGLDPSPALNAAERAVAGGVAGHPATAGAAAGPPGDAAVRPRRGGRGAAPAARVGSAGDRGRARAVWERPGSRWRSPAGPTPRRCCCSPRSPTRRRCRSPWPTRWG